MRSSILCIRVSCFIFCKGGYFRWWEISRKYWQDLSLGGNFHDATPISLIKSYRFYFRMGDFREGNIAKTRKFPRLQYITSSPRFNISKAYVYVCLHDSGFA